MQRFGALGAAPRSFADYLVFVERCRVHLEQDGLSISEGQPVYSGGDVLTDVCTEGLMLRRLEQEVAWAERKGEPVSLLRLRVRDWIQIQRRYSPTTTKDLLLGLARIFKTALRPYDFVGRVAPDQFAMVLREADAIMVSTVAVRIITAFDGVVSRTVGNGLVALEVATGTYPFDAESATELVSRTHVHWTNISPQPHVDDHSAPRLS